MNLNNLENTITDLEAEVSGLKGKTELLASQFTESQRILVELKELQEINLKAIELLNFVQKATKEKIKEMFETIVTKALQFIHQDSNYKFELEFAKRGNIPELKFNIKTPDMSEPHSIIDTRGGGTADIVSLALRLVLLEISKTKGFLFLDEPEKHLDSPETLKKMIEFVQETQRNTKRQIFIITHKQEVVDSVSNPIVISDNRQSSISKEPEPIKKKRGRPRKNVKKN